MAEKTTKLSPSALITAGIAIAALAALVFVVTRPSEAPQQPPAQDNHEPITLHAKGEGFESSEAMERNNVLWDYILNRTNLECFPGLMFYDDAADDDFFAWVEEIGLNAGKLRTEITRIFEVGEIRKQTCTLGDHLVFLGEKKIGDEGSRRTYNLYHWREGVADPILVSHPLNSGFFEFYLGEMADQQDERLVIGRTGGGITGAVVWLFALDYESRSLSLVESCTSVYPNEVIDPDIIPEVECTIIEDVLSHEE